MTTTNAPASLHRSATQTRTAGCTELDQAPEPSSGSAFGLDQIGETTTLAVSYLRVSTKEQASKGGRDEGFSIPAQREANLRKARELLLPLREEARRHNAVTRGAALALSVIRRDPQGSAAPEPEQPAEQGFLAGLKALFVPEADRHAYAEGIRRGGAVVTAVVQADRASWVEHLLRDRGAVDLDLEPAEHLQIEARRGHHDIGVEHLAALELDAPTREGFDLVGDDG